MKVLVDIMQRSNFRTIIFIFRISEALQEHLLRLKIESLLLKT